MDQALKARLIGAAILVGLAVLVIPELLSGRKSDRPATAASPDTSSASRTITIELGSQQGEQRSSPALSATTQTLAPDPVARPAEAQAKPSRDVETAAAANNVAGAPATANPAAASAPITTPWSDVTDPSVAPALKPAAQTSSASSARKHTTAGGRNWSVQVGAFGSSTAAQKLTTELDGAGFTAYVAPTRQGGKALHRVRVGPVPDRAEADRLAARLRSRGLPVTVVANN